MQTVGTTIRDRRMKLGLTVTALAEAVGTSKSYLSMIENDRVDAPPSREVLARIERALDITPGELVRLGDWQSTPAGVKREIEELREQARRGADLAKWLRESTGRRAGGGRNLDRVFRSGELRKRIDSALPGDGNVETDRPLPVHYQVPLINKVAAGYPTDFTDLDYPARVADQYVGCPEVDDPQAFAARVVGESMRPNYGEGDIVVFSPAASVASGDDCFVRLEPDHECTFKRVFFEEGDCIRLQPINPSFAARTVEREAVAGLYRAVWRLARL